MEINMNEEFNKNTNSQDDGEYVYKTVLEGKKNSRLWSVLSLVFSIVSIICCCVPWTGAILGVISIVFAIVSRVSIGYFDGLSIAGLIVGIFGVVFSVSTIIIMNSPRFMEIFNEYIKMLEESAGADGGIES